MANPRAPRIRVHHAERQKVVAGKSIGAGQEAMSAYQYMAGDADCRTDTGDECNVISLIAQCLLGRAKRDAGAN